MSDAVWCLVAEIPQKTDPPHRTKSEALWLSRFQPGAMIYCFPPLWSNWWRKNRVIGRANDRSRIITAVIPTGCLVNWRAELITDTEVIEHFWDAWDGSESSRAKAVAMADAMTYKGHKPTEGN